MWQNEVEECRLHMWDCLPSHQLGWAVSVETGGRRRGICANEGRLLGEARTWRPGSAEVRRRAANFFSFLSARVFLYESSIHSLFGHLS